MRFDDRLQICLLALVHRFPEWVVDINEELLKPQGFATKGHTPLALIAYLHDAAPHLLRAQAYILIDAQYSEIYLSDYSHEIAAFWIRYKGKRPSRIEVLEKHSSLILKILMLPPPDDMYESTLNI
jgi:hypothetical protein